MNDNYGTPITYQSIQRAESLIRRPCDGSDANLQSRLKAAAHLAEAAVKFEKFAELDPDSDVAVYLNTKALELRITASMA